MNTANYIERALDLLGIALKQTLNESSSNHLLKKEIEHQKVIIEQLRTKITNLEAEIARLDVPKIDKWKEQCACCNHDPMSTGNTCHEGLSDQARPVVIEGIPSSDSQCLLNDFESQPPSPRIDSYSHPAEPPTSVSVIPIVQCTQVYSPLLFTEGDIDTEEEEDLPHADMGEREMEDLATIEHGQDSLNKYAQTVAKRAGLPSYKFAATIRDRDKLHAKPCPECRKWFAAEDGIHANQRDHMKKVCRHKYLYAPPDSDPRIWEISFPNSEECERIMEPRK
eukprot:Em0013g632a